MSSSEIFGAAERIREEADRMQEAATAAREVAEQLQDDVDELRRTVWLLLRHAGGQITIPAGELATCPELPGLHREGDGHGGEIWTAQA